MKFLVSLLTATALLSTCASPKPLDERHLLAVRTKDSENVATNTRIAQRTGGNPGNNQASSSEISNKKDYDIDKVILDWFTGSSSERLARVCRTDGGWEGWAQYELEQDLKKEFNIGKKERVREVHVYTNPKEAADFVLEPNAKHKGMIIELKCENRNTNKGSAMKDKVKADIDKEKKVQSKYKEYSFSVLAMAYSADAEKAVESLGLTAIQGAAVEQDSSSDESESDEPGDQNDILKVYRKIISTDDGVDAITQGVAGLTTGGGTKDQGNNQGDEKGKESKSSPSKNGKAKTTTGTGAQGTTGKAAKAGKTTGTEDQGTTPKTSKTSTGAGDSTKKAADGKKKDSDSKTGTA